MDLFRSLAFISRMNFGPPPPVEITTAEIDLGGGERVTADVYRAPNLKSRGTILNVHGMTVYGYRDPRIVKLCTMLTVSGHTIVNPQYDEIADLRMEMVSLDRMERTVRVLTVHPELRPPSGKIAVIGHSFAAGMAMAVLARPGMEQYVNVICSIGGAYNFESSMKALMGRQDENHYPREIMLSNFLHHSIGDRPGVLRACRVALEDNGYERKEPHLPGVLANLDTEDRTFFEQLRTDPQLRLHHLQRFRPMIQPIIDALDGIRNVNIPVIIIHGLNDTVLPAAQAEELADALRERGVPVRLDISPLLDHNRTQIQLRMLGDAARMLGSFSQFFRMAAT